MLLDVNAGAGAVTEDLDLTIDLRGSTVQRWTYGATVAAQGGDPAVGLPTAPPRGA